MPFRGFTPDEEIRKKFRGRFKHFCENSPLVLKATIYPERVIVSNIVSDTITETFEFPFDYSEDLGLFIGKIKAKLYPLFPLISKKLDNGKKEVFIVEQVLLKYDEVALRSTLSGEKYIYKMNKSPILFLNKVRKGIYSPEYGGEYFFANTELIKGGPNEAGQPRPEVEKT